MAITPADRAVIARHAGSAVLKDEETVEEAIDRLGPYGAALELLTIVHADMSVEASKVSSGDDRHDHSVNLVAVEDKIGKLVSFLAQTTEITLNGAAERLLAEVEGEPAQDRTVVIDMEIDNSRRG